MSFQSRYKISASSFYNVSKCERRVYLDIHGDLGEKGEFSDFLEMLWEKGVQVEREIIEKLKQNRNISVVEGPPGEDTFKQTLTLMENGAPLIYQGVLIVDDHIGRPDLLERLGGQSKFGEYHYIPCDIKSGRATTDADGLDIKSHYANQILFYCELLEKIQNKRPDAGKIINIDGLETIFNVADYSDSYETSRNTIRAIVYDIQEPEPIIGGVCKECVWSDSCLKIVIEANDPTLLYQLGKQKYELRSRGVKTISDLMGINIDDFLVPPKKIYRVGENTLIQWKRRAECWTLNKCTIHTPHNFKKAKREVYYDIEDDPSVDHHRTKAER
jgi:predicted RecB family nuclease